MDKSVPVWVLAFGVFIAAVPLGFGIVGYLNPGFFGEQWSNGDASQYVSVFGFYLGRNMATALVTLFALSQRNTSMLILAFMLRIITDLFDTAHNIVAGTLDGSFIFFATV